MKLKMRIMKAKDYKIWVLPAPKSINKMINLLLKNIFLRMVKYITWTQEMCNQVVHIGPRFLTFIPEHFKTQEMCSKAVEEDPHTEICTFSSYDA